MLLLVIDTVTLLCYNNLEESNVTVLLIPYSLATIIVADFATNGNAGLTPKIAPLFGEAVQTEKRKTVSPVIKDWGFFL